jgi:hypothetical protein
MAQVAGEVLIKMGLDIAQLKRDSGDVKRLAQESAAGWQRAGDLIKGALAGVAAAFSVNAIQAWVKSSIDALDTLNDLQKRSALSASALLTLQGSAERAGESLDGLDGLLSKLPKKLSEAANEGSELGQLFSQLGLSAKAGITDLDGFLVSLGKVFSEFEDGPDKAALAIEILGKGGDKFIGTLEGLSDMRARYEELGITIDEKAIKAADQFNDTLKDVEDLSKQTARQFAAGLLPSLQAIVSAFVDMKKAGLDFAPIGKVIGDIMRTTAGEALALVAVFKRVYAEILAVINLFRNGSLPAVEALDKYKQERASAAADYEKQLSAAKALTRGESSSQSSAASFLSDLPAQKRRAPRVGAAREGAAKVDPLIKQQTDALAEAERSLVKIGDASAIALTYFETTLGKYKEFSPEVKKQLINFAQQTDERKRFFEQEQKVIAQEYELGKVIERQLEIQRERDQSAIDSVLGQTATKLIEEKRKLQDLIDKEFFAGKITDKQYDEATAIINGLRKVDEKAAETKDIFDKLGVAFESAAEKAIDNWEGVGSFFDGLFKDLSKIAAREFITGPILQSFKTMLEDMKKEASEATKGTPSVSSGGSLFGALFNVGKAIFGGGSSADPGGSFSEGNNQTKSVINVTVDSRTDSGDVRRSAELGVQSALGQVAERRYRGDVAFS